MLIGLFFVGAAFLLVSALFALPMARHRAGKAWPARPRVVFGTAIVGVLLTTVASFLSLQTGGEYYVRVVATNAETANLWVQTGVMIAAVGAAVVALIVSARDRAAARQVAQDDRAAALEQALTMFEIDTLLRLLANLQRGGSSDTLESQRLGSEALALIAAIGPEKLPDLWARKVGDREKLEKLREDETFPQYKRDVIEVHLALEKLLKTQRAKNAAPERSV